jgi:hypothetical protein
MGDARSCAATEPLAALLRFHAASRTVSTTKPYRGTTRAIINIIKSCRSAKRSQIPQHIQAHSNPISSSTSRPCRRATNTPITASNFASIRSICGRAGIVIVSSKRWGRGYSLPVRDLRGDLFGTGLRQVHADGGAPSQRGLFAPARAVSAESA